MSYKMSRSERQAMFQGHNERMNAIEAAAKKKLIEQQKNAELARLSKPPIPQSKTEPVKPPQVDAPSNAPVAAAVSGVYGILSTINDNLKDLREESIEEERKDLFAQSRAITDISIRAAIEFFEKELLASIRNQNELTEMFGQMVTAVGKIAFRLEDLETSFRMLVDKLMTGKK